MRYFLEPNNVHPYVYDETDAAQIPYINAAINNKWQEITDVASYTNNKETKKEQDYYNSLTYVDKRRMEYPNFLDYIDGVVKGDITQIQAYIDQCLAVKAKYPKS